MPSASPCTGLTRARIGGRHPLKMSVGYKPLYTPAGGTNHFQRNSRQFFIVISLRLATVPNFGELGSPKSSSSPLTGAGLVSGGAAFAVWAFNRSGWYRVGWFAESLPRLQWGQLPATPVIGLLSFHSELCAWQAAGLWVSALIDHWVMHTGAQSKRVTVVVDNAAALQVAAGHANPFDTVARWCRECWQAVQARCSTTFRHVHGPSRYVCQYHC